MTQPGTSVDARSLTREAEHARWRATAPGSYMLAWEQQRLDAAVADVFGFHALQLGLPELDALRANRMPHRWRVRDHRAPGPHGVGEPAPGEPHDGAPRPRAVALECAFDALPFPDQSIDLVVLPHTLELAREPHQALREVERVLMPEGRLVILGFNPTSLWGLGRRWGRLRRLLGARAPLALPQESEFIGYRRLRDWLRLLSFEVEGGRFGCYRPALRTERWLRRWAWIDAVGDRWWPVFGGVYFLLAVKRVRGMRLVGLTREARVPAKAAPAAAAAAQHRGARTHIAAIRRDDDAPRD